MDPKENGNDPAMPATEHDSCGNPMKERTGLTKREHFAALMMPSFLASFEGNRRVIDAASEAVYAADELLRALAAGGEG